MNDINQIAHELANGLSLEQLRARQDGPRWATSEPSPEAAARLEEYWNNVFTRPVKQSPIMMTRRHAQEMDYEVARKKVAALFNRRADEIERTGQPFKWEIPKGGELSGIIQNMIRYFINDPSCEWPLYKGLLVYGLPGAGKTEVMGIMQRFTVEEKLTKAFVMTSMTDIYTKARTDKQYDPMAAVQSDRCFDEFLRTAGSVNYYGDQIDLNEVLIEKRYVRNRNYGQLTHFITNGDTATAKDMLSEMLFDRIKGMCTGVRFPGESKR